MKKKLLSLVLAGAMVASTSVSAFAANVNGPDNVDGNAEISITGEIEGDGGEKPVGRFNVTIPTSTSFTVDKNGKFIAPERMIIQNEGSQDIDVYADKFVDTKPTEGIKVVAKSELGSKNRTHISLSVTGTNSVYLKSEDTNSGNNKGIYTTSDLSTPALNEQLKLTSISAGQNGYLTLDGKAGEKNKAAGDDDAQYAVNEGVSNTFTLMLKIKKATN